MPIYAFRCTECDHEYEELVSRMGREAPCPTCGSAKVERLLTAPADYRQSDTAGGEACQMPGCGGGGCGMGGACAFD